MTIDTNVIPNYHNRYISQFVPSCKYDANAVHGAPYIAKLGAPAILDADGILNDTAMVNGSAVTVTTFILSDLSTKCTYGRNITAAASSTNTRLMTVYGRDYLGQPMIEGITLTSGTTVSGKKAFMYIDKITFASASDTTTVDVGYGDVLGLPLACVNILEEIVNGVVRRPRLDKVILPYEIEQTELLAATSEYILSPIRGYVTKAAAVVQTAITTGGNITFEIANVAVVGLTLTLADSATAGTVYTDTPTSLTGATGLVAADGAIEIVPAAAIDTAGAINGYVEVTPNQFVAYDTTTATSTTGDTRGTYYPLTACDGTNTYEVVCLLDFTQLHGVAHYYA